MTVSSIISNPEAYSAQSNIHKANDALSTEVAQLSSGNRIQSASYDVAALSIGTDLKTQVNTLNIARQNTSLGTSMLQVADGALATLQSVLQDMQAIATQANSGSLTSTQHGFLDQKFQSDLAEINSIVGQTNFNGVNLLDGSLTDSNPLESATNGSVSGTVSPAATIAGDSLQTNITAITFKNNTITSNDTHFVGDLSKGSWTTVDTDATHTQVSYTINGETYTGVATAAAHIVQAGTVALTDGVGTISITVTTGPSPAALQTQLTALTSTATAYAQHTVLAADATDSVTGKTLTGTSIADTAANGSDYTNGTLIQGFDGTKVTLQSASFNGKNLPSISGFSASSATDGSLASLSVIINGQTYSTAAYTGSTTGHDIHDANGLGSISGTADFYLNGDTSSQEKMTLDFTGVTADAVDLSSSGGVQAFLGALNKAFGAGGGSGGLSFQVGTASTDTIGVTINNVDSSALFGGASPDVLTQSNAAAAATLVSTALNTVTAVRANVGALQSRFGFAAANLDSSIQNQDSARGQLLDTDIAATSTSFAISQVQLQAGISVLAQANQQLQGLIKLLG